LELSLRVQSQFSFVWQFSLIFAVLQVSDLAAPDVLLRCHLHSVVKVTGTIHARLVSSINRV